MYIYFNRIRLIHIHRCRLFLTMTLSPTIWPPARPPWLHARPSQAVSPFRCSAARGEDFFPRHSGLLQSGATMTAAGHFGRCCHVALGHRNVVGVVFLSSLLVAGNLPEATGMGEAVEWPRQACGCVSSVLVALVYTLRNCQAPACRYRHSVMDEHFLEFPILWPSGSGDTQVMNGEYQVSGCLVARGPLSPPGSSSKSGAVTLTGRRALCRRPSFTRGS